MARWPERRCSEAETDMVEGAWGDKIRVALHRKMKQIVSREEWTLGPADIANLTLAAGIPTFAEDDPRWTAPRSL